MSCHVDRDAFNSLEEVAMEPCFLVLENDPLLARSLGRVLSRFAPVRCEDRALDAERALDEHVPFCALVFNAMLPRGQGLDVLSHARKVGCDCPAVTYAPCFEPTFANRAFELDSHYVLDVIAPGSIESFARRAVARATRPYEETLADWTIKYALSPRESEILRDFIEGAVPKEIASSHDVSGNTLKKQIRSLLRKTGDASLKAAALRLLRPTFSGSSRRS